MSYDVRSDRLSLIKSKEITYLPLFWESCWPSSATGWADESVSDSMDLPVFKSLPVPHRNRIWFSSIQNQHDFGLSETIVKKSIFNSEEMPDLLSFKPALVNHFLRLFFLFVQKPAIFTFYLLHSRNICQSFGFCQLSFINWLTTRITYQYLTDF